MKLIKEQVCNQVLNQDYHGGYKQARKVCDLGYKQAWVQVQEQARNQLHAQARKVCDPGYKQAWVRLNKQF